MILTFNMDKIDTFKDFEAFKVEIPQVAVSDSSNT